VFKVLILVFKVPISVFKVPFSVFKVPILVFKVSILVFIVAILVVVGGWKERTTPLADAVARGCLKSLILKVPKGDKY
jgi:hypothetical protein